MFGALLTTPLGRGALYLLIGAIVIVGGYFGLDTGSLDRMIDFLFNNPVGPEIVPG